MACYRIILHFSDGENELQDEVFDTYEEAEEYAGYLIGCSEEGAETLHLSNPIDYPLEDFENPTYDIVED